MGSIIGMDKIGEEKKSLHCHAENRTPIVQPVA
jgi:hypothetical protein